MKTNVLSKREIEVLIWIERGKTSFEAGKILGISEHTIINHLENIKRKLNASNRTHAVAIALERRLLAS